MIMYRENSESTISVNPTRVEEMKQKGWTEDAPKKRKSKVSLEAEQTMPSNDTTEEVNDGES